MGKEQDWSQIAKHLADCLSEDEKQNFDDRLNTDQRFKQDRDRAAEIWQAAGHLEQATAYRSEQQVAQAIANMRPRLGNNNSAATSAVPAKGQVRKFDFRSGRFGLAKIAAAILLLLAATWLLQVSFTEQVPNAEWQVLRTLPGQQKSFMLNDGSTVVLNNNSTLKVAKAFAESREVMLTGEAYFEVKSGERPFLVNTEHTQVRVVGTAFNVRAYENEATTHLFVSEGKVVFANEGQELLLKANEAASFESETQSFNLLQVSAEESMAWQEGKLRFKDKSLEEAMAEISRWYGEEVVIKDPQLAKARFTGDFSGKTFTEVMERIAMTLGFTFSEVNGKWVIEKE